MTAAAATEGAAGRGQSPPAAAKAATSHGRPGWHARAVGGCAALEEEEEATGARSVMLMWATAKGKRPTHWRTGV